MDDMNNNVAEAPQRKRRPRIGERTIGVEDVQMRPKRPRIGERTSITEDYASHSRRPRIGDGGRPYGGESQFRKNVYGQLTVQSYQDKFKMFGDQDRAMEMAHDKLTLIIGTIDEKLQSGKTRSDGDVEQRLSIVQLDGYSALKGKSLSEMRSLLVDLRSKMDMDYIHYMCREGHPERAASYMKAMDSKTLSRVMERLSAEFKRDPGDERAEVYNVLLKPFNKSIVKIKRIDTPTNISKVVRAHFDGFLHVPEDKDAGGISDYTPAFKKFRNGETAKSSAAVDIEKLPIVQAIRESDNLSRMLPLFKRAAENQKIPADVLQQCNLADFTNIVYFEKYGKMPQKGENIEFKKLEPSCDDGMSVRFWDNLRKDKAKVKQMVDMLHDGLVERGKLMGMPAADVEALMKDVEKGDVLDNLRNLTINGEPVVKFSLHHNFYVQDSAAVGGCMGVNTDPNMVVVMDILGEKTHDNLHSFNASKDGYDYRMVDDRDDDKRYTWLVADMKNTAQTDISTGHVKADYRAIKIEMGGR